MQLPAVGQTFEDQYEVLSLLGEGSFGAVYHARDRKGREVALKVLKPDQNHGYAPATRARFEREARVLADLRHPNIVTMYRHGQAEDGLLYLVFEYVPGRDLSELLLIETALNPPQVEDILRQVLLALDAAHRAGLVHRDLKPDNIRVSEGEDGALVVKLLDFGIARATDDGHPSITKSGELVGTLRYMSPEQLSSKPLSPQSDIFSLGFVVFELLVGKESGPRSRLVDPLQRLKSGQAFSDPETERFGAQLLEILQKMTATQLDQRFASAAEVLAALEPLDATRDERTKKFRQPELIPRAKPLTRWQIVLASTIVGGGVAFLALTLLSPDDRDSMPTRPERTAPFVKGNEPSQRPPVATPPTAGAEQTAEPSPVASAGCGTPARGGVLQGENHLFYLPESYDPGVPHPTIIIIGPGSQSPKDLFTSSQLAALADRERAIVLVPDDREVVGDAREWRDDGHERLRWWFFNAAANRFCIDHARTYMIAIGSGVRIVADAICDPWLAAVAIHSFLPPTKREDNPFDCIPEPIGVMWITPTQSKELPFKGGNHCGSLRGSVQSLAELEEFWTDLRVCSEPHPMKSTAECTAWSCVHAPFASCRVSGGFGWPGSDFGGNPCDSEPPAAKVPVEEWVWNFFESNPPLDDPPTQ